MLLKLTDKEDTGFEGTIRVSFEYCPKGFQGKGECQPLFLDFHGEEISNVVINGEPSCGLKFEKHRILLPEYQLSTSQTNHVSF